MKLNQLTPLKVARTKKPGKYADGLGLYLEIGRQGHRSWSFRYMVNGRARELGLGPLHSVTLAEARQRAREARQLLLDGRDPIEVRHDAGAVAKVERLKTITFRQAALDFLKTDKVQGLKNDKHRAQWTSSLEAYAYPVLGDLPLNKIDTALVLKALLPVFERTPETGRRVRSRIERVFAWASPLGLFKGENPAALNLLKDHLPKKAKAKHHEAMPFSQLPSFMAMLRERTSLSARALEFTILAATRTNETIGARWCEIDLDAMIWVIPPERMKAGREHRVPITPRMAAILNDLRRDCDGFVFPGSKAGAPLSNMAMAELLKGTSGNGYTVHGMRSSFRDWCGERTNFPRDVVEAALAHAIENKTEAAYRRGDALSKRMRLMTEWSRFCESVPVEAATVVNLRA